MTVTLYWTGCYHLVIKPPTLLNSFMFGWGILAFLPVQRLLLQQIEKKQNPFPAEVGAEEKTCRILQGCCRADLFRRCSSFVVLTICPKEVLPALGNTKIKEFYI